MCICSDVFFVLFLGTLEEAKIYLQGIINHHSNYETESTLGRGRRIKKKKKLNQILMSHFRKEGRSM